MNHNMFPSSSSESSMSGATSTGGGALMRYASAPSSMISTAVESVIGVNRHHHFLFPSSEPSVASDSASTAKPNLNDRPFFIVNDVENHNKSTTNNKTNTTTSTTNYGFPHHHAGGSSSSSSPLVRHSSSPAQFLNHLTTSARGGDSGGGFPITSGVGNYNNSTDNGRGGILRLNSQLSFTSPKEVLSRISEETEGVVVDNNTQRKATNSNSFGNNNNNTSFGSILSTSWDENNQINFSAPSNKRSKGSIINDINAMEHHQFQFTMSQVPIDVYSKMDKLVHIPHDSVPCKVRAKRGCATHPRSIAERERRIRISGKLKKLQDLVPNMDKQTSYADMLDLAVQHIKSLQNHVEKLNKELESCTCGCKTIKDS